jgi:hypothetical protein
MDDEPTNDEPPRVIFALQQPGDTATAATTLAAGAAVATGWMAMASRSFCIENKMRENKMRHPQKQTKPHTVSGSRDCLGLDGGRDFGWLSQHDTSRVCSCVTLRVLHTLYLNTDQLATLLIIHDANYLRFDFRKGNHSFYLFYGALFSSEN